MAKQSIQTNLLRTPVKISETAFGEVSEHKGKHGVIASVYLDKEGNPKYTIRLDEGILVDTYSHNFVI